jgi:hypothetical protein
MSKIKVGSTTLSLASSMSWPAKGPGGREVIQLANGRLLCRAPGASSGFFIDRQQAAGLLRANGHAVPAGFLAGSTSIQGSHEIRSVAPAGFTC